MQNFNLRPACARSAHPVARLAALTLTLLLAVVPTLAQEPDMTRTSPRYWNTESGEYYSFDGVFYSFANESGQGVKLWTPPGEGPIRGVILHGNPGGGFGGDTRDKTRQRDLLEFAARHHFAVAGVTGFPGREVYPELGAVLLRAFEQWGELGVHPELAHLPFIATGGSNAAVFSFGMLCHAPHRAIAITPNCGPVYSPAVATDVARKVPAWMHVGTVDPLMPTGIENTETLFAEHAPQGVLWAWDAEIKGHENGSADHIDFAFWDAVIPLRLPQKIEVGKPVALRAIAPDTGWWVDHRSWDHTIAKVAPATEPKPFAAEAGRYGWVPNEGIARIYQATASRARVITLSAAEQATVEGGQKSGVYLSSGGSLIARPGDAVSVRLTLGAMVWSVQQADIYDQAEKLGTLDLSRGDVFTFTVDGAKRVYSLHARAVGRQGVERTSNPLQVIVADPATSKRIDEQLKSASFAGKFQAAADGNMDYAILAGGARAAADLPAHAIAAVRLTGEQEATLTDDGSISAVWEPLRTQASPVRLDAAGTVAVQAAYSAKGLYLLFSINDASAQNSGEESLAGSLDFHIASVGLNALRSAEPGPAVYAYARAYSVLRNALQVQIPTARPADGIERIAFNYWDPWDPSRFSTTSENNYDGLGLWIDRTAQGNGKRTVELFLPWAMVGNPGLAGMPPAGSSLAVELGYNPAAGEKNIRWPFERDPWAVPAIRDGARGPEVYGEIVLR